ncbi:nucleotide exchange factor GrpE [Basilea psittacipulmonis]|nr:nucleotide exchange factor GrpE [Basilea psittacipulmonis]
MSESHENTENKEEILNAEPSQEVVEQVDVEEAVDPLHELEEKVAQYHDQLLRAHAEMENLRKRTHEEVVKARKFGTESFAESLIPVKDSLEAALNQKEQSLESLVSGVETTLKQLESAFERNQLKEIKPEVGEKFNPHVHQAISSIASEQVEANAVIECLQKGYTIADRVLRPALVIVSAGKSE